MQPYPANNAEPEENTMATARTAEVTTGPRSPRRVAGKKYGNDNLHKLIQEHGLDIPRVAELVHASEFTVRSWLRPVTNASHRTMPAATMELLRIKLGVPAVRKRRRRK